MNVLVALEQRFQVTPSGQVFGPGVTGDRLWARYLRVFHEVRVLARLKRVTEPSAHLEPISLDKVVFEPFDNFEGPAQFVRKRGALRAIGRTALHRSDAVILRVPSIVASTIFDELNRTGRPYAVEVVGDSYDVLAPGANEHPLRPLFRWWLYKEQRRHCAGAVGGAYVTAAALQKRYPVGAVLPAEYGTLAGRAKMTAHYSSIELGEEWFEGIPLQRKPFVKPHVVTVSTLAQMYKGVDVLIEAAAICRDHGSPLSVTIVGEGQCKRVLEAQAATRGLAADVRFVGAVPSGAGVRAVLDQADMFVLASRQEGLPRALIEAMARGLPCIATSVGGIPELLEPSALVPPNNASALAQSISNLASNPAARACMSARNVVTARQYSSDQLEPRRTEFYQFLRLVTQTWQTDRQSGRAA